MLVFSLFSVSTSVVDRIALSTEFSSKRLYGRPPDIGCNCVLTHFCVNSSIAFTLGVIPLGSHSCVTESPNLSMIEDLVSFVASLRVPSITSASNFACSSFNAVVVFSLPSDVVT